MVFTDVCSSSCPYTGATLFRRRPTVILLMLKRTSTGDKTTTSLVVWWLRCHAPHAGALEFHPWSGNQVPHAANKTRRSQVNKKKKNCAGTPSSMSCMEPILPLAAAEVLAGGRGRGAQSYSFYLLDPQEISNVKSRQSWNRVSLVISFCPGNPAIVIKTQQNKTFQMAVVLERFIFFLHSDTQNQGVQFLCILSRCIRDRARQFMSQKVIPTTTSQVPRVFTNSVELQSFLPPCGHKE